MSRYEPRPHVVGAGRSGTRCSVVHRTLGLLALCLAFASTAVAARYVISDEEADEIVGEVQKPDVTVVISRENLNKSYEVELEESFLDKIVESVEHEPF